METRSHPELIVQLAEAGAGRALLERIDGAEGVYLVGGAVRDLLQGRAPVDLDLAVEHDAAAVTTRLGVPARSHDRFGTSTVWLSGVRCDIARTRRERYARPGALPDVDPAGIELDLQRRDFTVNAIALALGGPDSGTLLSVDGALRDLDARQLRVLHDGSFDDDPTRVLRLARYSGRLEYAIEPRTLELVRAATRHGAFTTVSGGRLGAELRLAAAEREAIAEFGVLRDLGADEALEPGFGISDPALADRALALLCEGHGVGPSADDDADDGGAASERAMLVLSVAGLGVAKPALRSLLDRLAFTAGVRDRVVAAACGAPRMAQELEAAGGVASQIAAAVGGAAPEAVALAGALGAADQARAWLTGLRDVRLAIDGSDLLAAGVAPGPAVGAGLAAARAATLDGQAPDRDAQLREALRVATSSG